MLLYLETRKGVKKMEKLLGIKEVSDLLGVSQKSCYDKLYRGFLPAPLRIGRLLRWRQKDIEQWLDNKETA